MHRDLLTRGWGVVTTAGTRGEANTAPRLHLALKPFPWALLVAPQATGTWRVVGQSLQQSSRSPYPNGHSHQWQGVSTGCADTALTAAWPWVCSLQTPAPPQPLLAPQMRPGVHRGGGSDRAGGPSPPGWVLSVTPAACTLLPSLTQPLGHRLCLGPEEPRPRAPGKPKCCGSLVSKIIPDAGRARAGQGVEARSRLRHYPCPQERN